MAVDVEVDVNTVEITNFLKKLSRKQKSVISKGLKRVSNMAILMITKRTQAGKLPDGGKMRGYAKGTVRSRKKRGRQTGFVDLTDTGKMFRSLDFRTGGMKSTLFFANKEREKIASYHDTFGVGKRRITRPFFAVGNKEEDKLKAEFAKFYYKEMRI
tara:strand:+ start:6860 stop:7330 length:471 start_codon:yes stop_codon:yes gene_type:complete